MRRRAPLLFALITTALSSATARSAERADDTPVDATPRAPRVTSAYAGRWGDFSLVAVERFGYLSAPNAERGSSGAITGSGWELRFIMPPGWGAYYRWSNSSTNQGKGFDWYHLEYVFGMSRRLHSTGSSAFASFRTQSRLDFGLAYFQAGTNVSCTRSVLPLGTTCDGTSPRGNASGAGIAGEVRAVGEVDIGPIAIGLDVGIGAYRRWSTGSDSVSLPPWSFIPSAQLKLGLALPFAN